MVGIEFLVVTTSMGDLLLNAMALAFIVDIDNILFAAFAPQRLKSIVRSVGAVYLPPSGMPFTKRWRPTGLSTCQKVTLVFTILICVYYTSIHPFYWRMNQAYDILCSGERDFVYVVNGATGLVEVTRSFSEAPDGWAPQELAILQVAKPTLNRGPGFKLDSKLIETVRNGAPRAVFQMGMEDTRNMLHGMKMAANGSTKMDAPNITQLSPAMWHLLDLRQTFAETINENVEGLVCADMSFSTVKSTADINMEDVSGGYRNCSQVKYKCDWWNMTSLRALCPVTCGCRDLADPAASFFAAGNYGCPAKCERDVVMVKQRKSPIPSVRDCVDTLPASFVDDPALRKYITIAMEQLLSHTSTLMTVHTALVDDGSSVGIPRARSGDAFKSIIDGRFLAAVLRGQWDLVPGYPHPRGLQGCRFWTSWEVRFLLGIDFCTIDKFRSLRPYCPKSCGCVQGRRQCPASCPELRQL
uniref:Uncharacterized protein n=1 Tax=Alexandrium catenella TaxID=2925 RepID=A0A7S1QYD6_ALECA